MEESSDKKVTKVIRGSVVEKKPSVFASIFKEDVHDLKDYIIKDILIPSAQDTISDLVRNGIDFLIYGDSKAGRANRTTVKSSYGNATYVNYNSISNKPRAIDSSERRMSNRCDDVILEDKGEAEAVLDNLLECIDTYGMVSVGDLYDLVGKATEHTDYKYGWNNLSSAAVQRVREGYLLKLPKTIAIS